MSLETLERPLTETPAVPVMLESPTPDLEQASSWRMRLAVATGALAAGGVIILGAALSGHNTEPSQPAAPTDPAPGVELTTGMLPQDIDTDIASRVPTSSEYSDVYIPTQRTAAVQATSFVWGGSRTGPLPTKPQN
jgi:hypothetical protein